MTDPPDDPEAAPPPDSADAQEWTAPVPAAPESRTPVTARLTWFRLHAGATVIDFPMYSPTAVRSWVATVWPDTRIAGGWQRQPWQPGPAGRGFVPAVLELGDVVQFGIEHAPPLGTPPGGPPLLTTWHGYLHTVRGDSILIHGPHPGPRQALAAAQLALVEQIHHTAHAPEPAHPGSRGAATHLGPPDSRAPISPAQPPTALSVTFNGTQATVGDPFHGWLVVDTTQLTTALTRTSSDLTQILTGRVHLTGREPPITLAALAAQHAPDHLTYSPNGPAHAQAPSSPPTAEPPDPANPADPPAPPSTPTPEASL